MMKMKGADAFERSLKEALENYEVPYNSADWSQMEKQLDGSKSSNWQASAGLYVLFLGGSVAMITAAYMMLSGPQGSGSDNGTGTGSVALVQQPVAEESSTTTTDATARFGDVALDIDTDGAGEAAVAEEPVDMKATTAPARGTSTHKAGETTTANRTPAPIPATMAPADPVLEAPGTNAPAIRPSVTEACPGTTVEFAADNMPEDGIFLWNFGDGNFSNKPTPSHTFSKSGTFEVMLSHSSLGGGNIRNKPAADRIVIHEAPEAAFNYLKQEYENTVPSIHFENRSIGGSKYLWEFGDGTTSTTPHPNHVFKKKGTYQVVLTTTNGRGCVDRAERTIVVENDYDLFAPKTFSPDGNGVEDTFIPEALKTLGAKFHMSIFHTESGELIYETQDSQRPWNGRITNKGELCLPGDYVWMVEMKDGEKLGGTYTGNVTLVR